jgi:UDP-2,4-diacetamido-2,4,6-trideoxy-beta-L-altropyranose hydrolase
MKALTVLFRADASASLGLGHVMRLVALAEALRAEGGRAIFLLGGDPNEVKALVESRGFEVYGLETASGSPLDVKVTRAIAQLSRAQACVVDGYHFGSSYLRCLGEIATVLAVDDLGYRPLPVDIVVNPGFGAELLDYHTAPYTQMLLGPSYALLRPEFTARERRRLAQPAGSRPRVLLSFGGTDPAGGTARALRLLPQRLLHVTAIVGPSFQDQGELAASATAARAAGHHVDVLRGVGDMAALLSSTDVAISAAGGTLLELAYFGVPTLAFVTASNQAHGAASLWSEGYVLRGGRLQLASNGDIARSIEELFEPTAHEVGRRFSGLVDGQGASRVMEALSAHVAARASRLAPLQEVSQ